MFDKLFFRGRAWEAFSIVINMIIVARKWSMHMLDTKYRDRDRDRAGLVYSDWMSSDRLGWFKGCQTVPCRSI